MRHKRGNKKLSKPTDQRIALLRSLTRALIINGSIETTDTRAHQLKSYYNKLSTLARKADHHHFKLALKMLPDKESIHKLFEEYKSKANREGSNLELVKCGFRKGDAAPLTKVTVL